MYARFDNGPLKTVGDDNYTKSTTDNVTSCLKWLSLKNHNSVEINFISIKPHMLIFIMSTKTHAWFRKNPLKSVGPVEPVL